MIMRRPRSAIGPREGLSAQDIAPPSTAALPVGAWYVAVIAVLLLVAAGVYIVYLHQQRLQWRDAANQMSIGQELLRADRDELLQKAREREAELSGLERRLSQRETRLASLQSQRNESRADVARLTQDLAKAERQLRKNTLIGKAPVNLGAAQKEHDLFDEERRKKDAFIEKQDAEIKRLERSLADTEQGLVQSRADLRRQKTLIAEARLEKAVLEEEATRSKEELAKAQQAFRRGQIVRGYNASLGEVKPYLAEVGPEYWQVIEGWLNEKLKCKMTIPDLSTMGWSYEGARLLVMIGGPTMVMLLYADPDGNPISLTIAQDKSGQTPPRSRLQAGLNLIEWRDRSHAFTLVGAADEVVLQVVASALQDQRNKVPSDSPVPSGRFFRPEFRPEG